MTTCATCNTQNLDGSQHCDACGAPLAAAADVSASLGTAETGGGTGNGAFAKGAAAQVKAESSSLATALSGASASAHSVSVVEAPHATLVIERGRSAGKRFPLTEDESQIGRWDADGGIFPEIDLDADDPEAKVSRRHARITRRENEYSVEDLGSTNGTFINRGRRLLPGDRHPLRDGDEIIVGKTFLRFHLAK
jgi:pSer/pThr/pTyr-binding forkhead associated (FHA) protein